MNEQLRHKFAAQATVFLESEPGDCAFIVESGRVEIRRVRGDQMVVLAVREPGEIFGEMALIDGQPRSASAVATEPSELLMVSRTQLNSYLGRAEPIMRMLLTVILERFRNTLSMMNEDGSMPVELLSRLSEQETQASARFAPAVEQLKLVQDVQEGIEREEFELHFQPLISMQTNAVYGFESLIRWRHPQRGLISPVLFIPAAEQSGQIIELGRWIFEQACKAARILRDTSESLAHSSGPIAVGVNVSGAEFSEPGFVEFIRDAAERYNVEPKWITLEITETLLMDQPAVAQVAIEQCREIGFRIAIDDFGTGYSSLNYLHRFPIDILKIDQSFVASILDDERSRQVVTSIVALARGLGMAIVAEGIEHQAEHEALVELDCDYAQGYLHSRPLPLHDAREFLRHWNKG